MKRLALGLFCLAISGTSFAQAELIGGRPAPAGEFPVSVYASMGSSRCTATVVGERTLFIAAHCVSNGGTATFSVGGNQYSSRCTHAPGYRNDSTADWSLCVIDRKVTGAQYEVLNTDATRHVIGQEVLLTGYGCIRSGGSGGNDGVYRIGEAKVTAVPRTGSNDIVTRGSSALCFGDSGGPAFLYLDAAKTKRVMISINSRGDIATTSYLSSVSTASAKSFISSWATTNSQKICGVHADAVGCRNSGGTDPDPTDPSNPTECEGVATHVAKWQACLTATSSKPTRDACDAAQEAMTACYEARYP